MPVHDAQTLWRREQGREQVWREQRGHVYLGMWIWQMRQRDERRGSAMVLEEFDVKINVRTFAIFIFNAMAFSADTRYRISLSLALALR